MPEEKKVEYADFSDMGKNQLPNEIEETPMGDQNIAIDYGTEESLKGEAPEGQPQKENQGTPEKENPDSMKYWQSQHDKKEAELQQLRSQYQQDTQRYTDLQREIQNLREGLNPKPKEEVLTEPQKPNTDYPNEILKWQSDYLMYQNKLIQKQNQQFQQMSQGWEQEMNRRHQEEEYVRTKTFYVGEFIKQGMSPDEANEAFVMFSKAQQDPDNYMKNLTNFFRFQRGQGNTQKSVDMGNRVARQGEVPPLVNATSETETQKKDPAQAFWQDMKQFEKKFY